MKNEEVNTRLSSEMEYRQRINQSMLFIRDNIDLNLSIREVAQSANFSRFHFHRIFTAYIGETPGDYMNRVKMIRAALCMKEGLNTTQAAIKIGYKTPSAFIKAFKKTFNILPSDFRELKLDQLKYMVRPPVNSGNEVKPEFRNLPKLDLYIVRRKGKLNENFTTVASAAFEQLHQWLVKEDQYKNIILRLGVLHDFDLINSNDCRYDACVFLEADAHPIIETPVQCITIKAGTWAVFLHKGPYDTLWQTWNLIYNSWYPLGGVELREENPFEVYLNNKNETAPSNLLTEIHIPVYQP